jgi:hypothetical protein
MVFPPPGVISLLYSVLLRDGLRVSSKIPEQLSDEMDAMATKGLRFLNFLATADLALVQVGRYLRFAFFEAMNILPSIFSF